MDIRHAIPADNEELQALQARCQSGTGLVITTVNTPDFFARAKAYETCQVYVACLDGRIVGSAACALRRAPIQGETQLVGYEFQYFTSPDHRREGIASRLHQQIEGYLRQQGAVLSYLIITEGNAPSMRLFESQGFKRYRTLLIPLLLPHTKIPMPPGTRIRPAAARDLEEITDLMNATWEGYDLYAPVTAGALARFVERTPEYTLDNVLILERRGRIDACLGYWDWSKITQITVESLNTRLRLTGLLLDVARTFRPMPHLPRRGEVLKQWCLTPIAYRDPDYLARLLRYVNNQAVQHGIGQILTACKPGHPLLQSMKELFRSDVKLQVYTKPFQQGIKANHAPLYLNAIDL